MWKSLRLSLRNYSRIGQSLEIRMYVKDHDNDCGTEKTILKSPQVVLQRMLILIMNSGRMSDSRWEIRCKTILRHIRKLHGPHQAAQKSTTKRGYRVTACEKFESVNSIGVEITSWFRVLLVLLALNSSLLLLARISSSSLSSFCTLLLSLSAMMLYPKLLNV